MKQMHMKANVCRYIQLILIFIISLKKLKNYVLLIVSIFLVIGIQWNNIFMPGNNLYGIVGSPGFIFLFSILGAVIHFTLAVYINAILPGKYGVRKNPLYFLKVNL